MPFHTFLQQALSSGAAVIIGNPSGLSNGGRMLTEADAWAHFRLKKLSFRMHPNALAAGTFITAGWVGGVQDTPPASAGNVMDLIPSCVYAKTSTVPTEWVRVPKQDLAGPLPWYKTIAGSADATEEAPGELVFGGTTTDAALVEIRGVIEFKTSVSTANTPAEVALRARLRAERLAREHEVAQKRVLALLGCQPVLPSQPTLVLPSGRVIVRE